MSYVQLYMLSLYLMRLSSKSSTHWKLDTDSGKVYSVGSRSRQVAECKTYFPQQGLQDDLLMDLLSRPLNSDDVFWTVQHCSERKDGLRQSQTTRSIHCYLLLEIVRVVVRTMSNFNIADLLLP